MRKVPTPYLDSLSRGFEKILWIFEPVKQVKTCVPRGIGVKHKACNSVVVRSRVRRNDTSCAKEDADKRQTFRRDR